MLEIMLSIAAVASLGTVITAIVAIKGGQKKGFTFFKSQR